MKNENTKEAKAKGKKKERQQVKKKKKSIKRLPESERVSRTEKKADSTKFRITPFAATFLSFLILCK